MKKFTLLLASIFSYGVMNAQTVLFDNGPLVNSPGAGAGGANVSNLHDGLGSYGAGHAVSSGFKVADDFTVPASGWTIDSLVFFAYQTGSTTTSTINAVKIGIWDASPATGTIVYGDTGVSALSSSYWSGIYRTTETTLTDVARPIMRNIVNTPGLSLNAGTYFISWQTGGTLASGPWAPPITINGVTTTGNALQFNPATPGWAPLADGTLTTEFQGLPFLIYGHVNSVVTTLNDSCITAIDLNSSFGQPVNVTQTTGPYDNNDAITGTDDPTTGFECFGEPDGGGAAPELNNTLWFSFVGDGGLYFIETGHCVGETDYIDDGDTQIAIYTGSCGALVPEACNEDGPNATTTEYPAGLNLQTTLGTTYYMLVDGFSLNGAVSNGQFCLNITNVSPVACGDPGISIGTESQSTDTLCFGATLTVTTTGVVAPTAGTFSGVSWVISTADISGNSDPLNDPSFITSYIFNNPAPSTSFRTLLNDGTFIGGPVPFGLYFWTPVVFGNATAPAPNPTFLQDLTLDPACTYTGTSLSVLVLADADPLCITGITENNNSNVGISNLYPVPVRSVVNFTINAKDNGTVTVAVKDNVGREVISQQLNAIKGENKVTLDLAKQSAGVYFITVTSNESTVVSKFVKQ